VRTLLLRESQPEVLPLTALEAAALQEAGRRLVGPAKPWGDDDSDSTRTVVRCEPLINGQWRVTVDNAVGLIGLGHDTQLVVSAKIPSSHLLHLFGASGRFPRLDPQAGSLSEADSLWQLVAEWFLTEAERTIRRDLRRDYESLREELAELRGTLDPLCSASAYYAGRIGFTCDFDDFNVDIPLNRVIRAAAQLIVQSPDLLSLQRRRGRSILARMEDVGALRTADLHVEIDRCTAHYANSLLLARHILAATGRTFEVGGLMARTFLIRTPETVEEGLRRILMRHLPDAAITKQGATPRPTTISLTPDLWFQRHQAIADVKYKLAGGEWKRADLYQAVAFATGFHLDRAAIIEFSTDGGNELEAVQIGAVHVRHLCWRADENHRPLEAEARFVRETADWLGRGSQRAAVA